MAIDDVMERARIVFPRFLSFGETENLLDYIAVNLPGTISYFGHQFQNLNYDNDSGEVYLDNGSFSFGGRINHAKNFSSNSFESEFSRRNEDKEGISALIFSVVPDFSLGDYHPKTIQLWDEVRGIIGLYFIEGYKRK